MVVIIKMKGLPWEATARDIRKFYRGLNISEEDIHLAPSQEGKASGFAFACFQEDDEARKAMYRNGNYVGKRYIELVLSSQSEMEKTLSEGVRFRRFDGSDRERPPEIETLRTESKTKSIDLRESSKITRDISRRSRSRSPIRKSASVDGLRSRRDHGGSNHVSDRRSVTSKKFNDRESLRSTNSSANGLATTRNELDRRPRERERERRRSSDRSELGKISASYGRDREGRETRLETSGARQGASNGFRREPFSSNNRSRRDSTSQDGANSKSTWVSMNGLPYSVTESEILQFFSGLNVVGIHLMVHTSGPFAGKQNGHGYVEFKSVGDCIQGEDRNRQFIRRRYCGVKRCSFEEVLNALGDKIENSWRFQEPNTIIGGNFSQESAMYSVGNMNGEDQNLSTPDLGMAVNSLGVNSVGKMPIPHNAVVGMEGPLNPVNQLAAGANISVNDISAGCVIGIRNLPSTVSAEEILDFFYGFPIIPDSIRIHYLAPGRSSGDAMVTLPTSGEAYSAIEQLNNKPVGKRKVQLFLV
ncbi:RNA-binding protein 12B-like [Orbicella faveolata]|uniref:RNA-binding protein 12B-like n=1 Tax=Orbicella faveolata TaxID=48498 RepID=UPI0009E26474|nr:RNA-binding protein 12B-like [Orbicella faveolata]